MKQSSIIDSIVSQISSLSNNDYLNPAGNTIEKEDVLKVQEHAKAINLSPDRKILHVLSQNFNI